MSMDNMGKPIPVSRKEWAYELLKEWGLTPDTATGLISKMSEQLERDKPYEAMEACKDFVDLTGAYRLMAVLLTDPA
jgi:hypothetical protein